MLALILTLAISVTAVQAPSAYDALASRPEWLDLAKQRKLPAHSEAIASELWATPEEARDDALEKAAVRALDFAADSAPRLRNKWAVPTWLVRDRLLREPVFVEEVERPYGTMYRAHLLLDLTPEKRDLLLSAWHEVVLRERTSQIGGGLAFLFICLTTVFGYLRLDEATRGYYSRRLLTGATALVAGSAALLYTWIV